MRRAALLLLAALSWPCLASAQESPPEPPPEAEPVQPQPDEDGSAPWTEVADSARTKDEENEETAGLNVEDGDDTITKTRYVGAGLTGTIVGFGIGHMMVGEWTKIGWLYTFGELLGVGAIVVGSEFSPDGPDSLHPALWLVPGLAVWGLLHIAEVVDIWYRPYYRFERESRRISRNGPDRVFGYKKDDHHDVLTESEYIFGGLVGTLIGFGIGHYMTREPGWGTLFLVTEALGGGVFVAGMSDRNNVGLWIAGWVGGLVWTTFWIWETVDVWVRPRHQRLALGYRGYSAVTLMPILAPVVGGGGLGGGVVGLGGRF